MSVEPVPPSQVLGGGEDKLEEKTSPWRRRRQVGGEDKSLEEEKTSWSRETTPLNIEPSACSRPLERFFKEALLAALPPLAAP
jgi:hypothetical protein